MSKVNLSIIIINFNTCDLTIDCIKSIKNNLNDANFEIILINNYPRGNDYSFLKNKYKDDNNIKIYKSANKGFGAANNLGTKKARGKFLLFLNSDTIISDNSLEKMINYLKKNNNIGIIGPLFYTVKGKLQKHFCGDFQNLKSLIFSRKEEKEINLNQEFNSCQMTTGAAMMIEKKFFEKLGGFDEKFFMYFEDEDLCRRALKSGKINGILTTAKITHLEGKSSNITNRKKMYYRSQNYYWRKHKGLFLELIMRFFRFPYVLWQKIKK
ncbi:MAG: glycosyltransferase family 2 protein [Candidatus Falkowbacteria bacterium]|nr:glycosyltransferase family 2 protein [Candidatus Falkowbacteria bacterium]